jgi:hypothetical protein
MRVENLDFITITSAVDDPVEIISVVANRGNCKDVTLQNVTAPPKTLKYGEVAGFIFDCIAIELEVKTNQEEGEAGIDHFCGFYFPADQRCTGLLHN